MRAICFNLMFFMVVALGLTEPVHARTDYSLNALESAGLTKEEIEVYQKGPLEQSRRGFGYGASYIVGLGIGHMIVREWSNIGWVFTFGQLASWGGMIAGAVVIGASDSKTAGGVLLATSIASYFGLRIWEILDLATRVNRHKIVYGAAEEKLLRKRSWNLTPFVDQDFNTGLQVSLKF